MRQAKLWFVGLFCVSLSGATAVGEADAAGGRGQIVYLTLRTGAQRIEGSVYRHGHEGTIECRTWQSAVTATKDASRPEYAPIVCRKPVDASSPLIAKALVENQSLDAEFAFVYVAPSGGEFSTYGIFLKDARVVSIRQSLAPDTTELMEEVGFSFRAIEWRAYDPVVSYSDQARPDVAPAKPDAGLMQRH